MTYALKEILDMFHIPVEITYRMFTDDGDRYCGMAQYENYKLTHLDGDEYFLDDAFARFEWRQCDDIGKVVLTVWDRI